MPSLQSYRDLIVWQKSMSLAKLARWIQLIAKGYLRSLAKVTATERGDAQPRDTGDVLLNRHSALPIVEQASELMESASPKTID